MYVTLEISPTCLPWRINDLDKSWSLVLMLVFLVREISIKWSEGLSGIFLTFICSSLEFVLSPPLCFIVRNWTIQASRIFKCRVFWVNLLNYFLKNYSTKLWQNPSVENLEITRRYLRSGLEASKKYWLDDNACVSKLRFHLIRRGVLMEPFI